MQPYPCGAVRRAAGGRAGAQRAGEARWRGVDDRVGVPPVERLGGKGRLIFLCSESMSRVAWKSCKVGRPERDITAWRDANMQTTGLAESITLIEKLSPEGKRQLIEYIARNLQRIPSAPVRLSWQPARGLGKD